MESESRTPRHSLLLYLFTFCTFLIQALLEQKQSEIDQNKNELITSVKQMAAKLKFTLNGSVVRDLECLKMSMEAAKERLVSLEEGVVDAVTALNKASNDSPEIRVGDNAMWLQSLLSLYILLLIV